MRCSPRSSSPRCSAGAARAACGGHWGFAARGFPHGGCSGTRRSRPVDACNLLGGLGRVSWPETAIAAAAMLCAGVLEEILFRGLLLGALMPRGPRRAVWLSALAFGLVHALNLLGGARSGGDGGTDRLRVCRRRDACAAHAALRKHPARRGDARRAQRAERSYRARRRREKSPDRRAHDGACRPDTRFFCARAGTKTEYTDDPGAPMGGFR